VGEKEESVKAATLRPQKEEESLSHDLGFDQMKWAVRIKAVFREKKKVVKAGNERGVGGKKTRGGQGQPQIVCKKAGSGYRPRRCKKGHKTLIARQKKKGNLSTEG